MALTSKNIDCKVHTTRKLISKVKMKNDIGLGLTHFFFFFLSQELILLPSAIWTRLLLIMYEDPAFCNYLII